MTGEEKGTGKVRGRSVIWPLLLALRFQVDKRNLTDVEKNERRRNDKNPMPGHLSELPPVNEVQTKGQCFRASFGKNPRFQIHLKYIYFILSIIPR